MNRNLNLTEGKITSTLAKLALPIMGTSFIQMAYSMTDTMWLGRYSTGALAAVGATSNLTWFGSGLVLIAQIGLGISVAHAYGRNDLEEAKRYISNGFQLDLFIGIIFSMFLFLFRHQLVGFFNLNQPEVISMALDYLEIISIGFVFFFVNPIFSTILNSAGNSVTPFKLNTIGLITNMILDPLLIFGLGPLPSMGAKGAAIATVFAQFVVTVFFLALGKKNNAIYFNINIFTHPDFEYIKRMIKLGVPPFLQTSIHAGIAMIITRIVAGFGDTAVAVQNIGTQIESLSWMSAEGFASAISAFIGQNYGAKKLDRIKKGYYRGMQILGSIGILCTLLLVLGAEPLIKIFTPEDIAAIREGINYLRIVGLSQFSMVIEIGTSGAFNGIGKTVPPTLIGVIFNVLRIPAALALSSTQLGLKGIWWAISISSIIKGTVSPALYINILRNKLKSLIENNN